MALSIRSYTIVRVVQAINHQGEVRYCGSRGIQCSYMSLISIKWTLFKSPGLWDKFELDYILGKENQLFKFIDKFRYLGMKDFLENMAREIIAGAYLLSITEVLNSVQQIGTGTLLIANNYILGLIRGTDSTYMFDSHNKDENSNSSNSGTAVLLNLTHFTHWKVI